ncbi:hypothetical protein SAMN05216316_0245 [Nitrosovibrio sp. Nv6]|nr:hypothetical protein SAMN05216316_0245 [Nitrosovibrio sp. Nv6]
MASSQFQVNSVITTVAFVMYGGAREGKVDEAFAAYSERLIRSDITVYLSLIRPPSHKTDTIESGKQHRTRRSETGEICTVRLVRREYRNLLFWMKCECEPLVKL